VTATSATLNGFLGLYPGDAGNCGAWRFDYGTTSAYGSSTPTGPASTGANVPVSATITGLTPATLYHFRLRADTGSGNVGIDVTVATLPGGPPSPACGAMTGAASAVSATGATLNGVLGAGSGSEAAGCGTWQFDYGTTAAYGSATSPAAASSGTNVPVSAAITGLAPGTTYHFRLRAAAGAGNLAADVTFTTPVVAPPPPSPPVVAAPPPATVSPASPAPSTPLTPATSPRSPTSTPPNPAPSKPSAAPPKPGVVLDRSIGGISIGMTEAAVEKLVGPPRSKLGVSLGNGEQGRFVRYRSHGKPLLATYDASGRVVSIEAYAPFFKTAGGLGPGSPLTGVGSLKGFHVDYCEFGYWDAKQKTGPDDAVTVFTASGGTVASVLVTQSRLYTTCEGAGPQPVPPVTLVLNHSIGDLSIGMTEEQITKQLGTPSRAFGVSLGDGTSGRFARYSSHGAPLLVTFDGSGRVVSLEAYSPFFRTAGGAGPGASLAQVRSMRGFRPDYCELGYWNGTAHTRPDDLVTVFTPNTGTVASVLITELRLYTACDTGSKELPPT
jgi:hypothetical protein